LTAVFALAAVSLIFIVLIQNSLDVKVSNFEVRYGFINDPQHSDVGPVADVSVKNTCNSDIISEKLTINGQNSSTVFFLIPGNETRNIAWNFPNLSLKSLRTYSIQIAFTFADGKQQSYSSRYITPEFSGQIQILSTSISLPNSSDTSSVGQFFYAEGVSVFRLNVMDVGNLPITQVDVSFSNLNGTYTLEGINYPILQNETAYGWDWLWLGNNTTVFPATIRIMYSDGSVSTVQAANTFD